jgi:hypothetical protein
VLGNLPTRTTAEKRHHRKHDKILHATLIFTRTKKTVTYETLAKKRLCQTNQNADFGKPDFDKKRQSQRNRDNFTNSTYQNFREKKSNQF